MEKQWYFNTVTEQPELGMISPASHRMGPYRTREDALDAWKIVQERNLKWEEQDREWKRWSADGSALISGVVFRLFADDCRYNREVATA